MSIMRLVPALVLGLIAFAPAPASASFLQASTARDDLEAREVDRGLVLGKGWVHLSLEFSWKQSTSGFIRGESPFNVGDGSWQAWRNNGKFTHRTFRHRAEWGFTRRSLLWIDIPFVWNSLTNDLLGDGGGISSFSIGDVAFGWRNQWVSTDRAKFRTHFATDIGVKAPTGSESPGTYLGGPANVSNIITGTGTYDIRIKAALRQQLSVLALDVWAGYTHKPGAIVQWLLETESNQFNARVDPGDTVHLDVGLAASPARPLTLRVDFKNTYRMATRVGTSTRGVPACRDCKPVPDTAGFWGDIRGSVQVWSLDFPLGVEGYFEYTLWGRNSLAFWPLEDLSPSRGWTAGGKLFARF